MSKKYLCSQYNRQQNHKSNIKLSQMFPNVTILATEHNKQDLALMKAVLIKQNGPKINIQTENFSNTLKFF